jgi:hypothetical protein
VERSSRWVRLGERSDMRRDAEMGVVILNLWSEGVHPGHGGGQARVRTSAEMRCGIETKADTPGGAAVRFHQLSFYI